MSLIKKQKKLGYPFGSFSFAVVSFLLIVPFSGCINKITHECLTVIDPSFSGPIQSVSVEIIDFDAPIDSVSAVVTSQLNKHNVTGWVYQGTGSKNEIESFYAGNDPQPEFSLQIQERAGERSTKTIMNSYGGSSKIVTKLYEAVLSPFGKDIVLLRCKVTCTSYEWATHDKLELRAIEFLFDELRKKRAIN